MKTQNQVKRILKQPEAITRIRSILDGNENLTRTLLSDQLCEHYGFYDPLGGLQKGSCIKALRELDHRGAIVLPMSLKRSGNASPRRLLEPVPTPFGVPLDVGDVQGLKIILVESTEHMRIWNEMMFREHPQGAGPLVGRQLRYLVDSDHGWLGGFSFSSAALQLEDRDKWIGWDVETRRAHLHRVIAMSRFLIRPEVHCHNLASLLLGQILQNVPDDFEQRYGLRPWLVESFVDISRFSGGCYRAANWVRVGCTKGRGRQDRDRKMALTVKDIYLYPLDKEFRAKLGLAPDSGPTALDITDGLNEDTWAEKEFGNAPLGDKRLSDRLVECASAKAKVPDRAFTGVAKGDWAAVKGYYRMIDHPDETAVSMENILKPHRERTIRRMMAQKTVLCIQDGTSLNYSGLSQCEGLGVIGTNQTDAQSMGLHLHSTFVVNSDGLPLGILRAECLARESKSKEDKRPPASIPIEEKNTYSWIQSLRDCVAISHEMPHTKVISVTDREADFYELFDEQRKNPTVDLLVRAKHNRSIKGGDKLFSVVKESPVCSRISITVDRKSARPKKSKQKASPKRIRRIAEVSLRYKSVELRSPDGDDVNNVPITLTIVHVVEDNPPAGEEGVEWFLLTTVDVQSAEDAEKCLRWYCLRWRIEDWHRVLKTGCSIEEAAHKTAERLKRAIAINLVIGWRIMLMTLLGRETPELPAEVLFSDIEIKVLQAFANTKQMKPPDMLGDAVKLVARLGGYLARNSDPPPGHQLMWQGYAVLRMMCEGYLLRC
jgi:hypothetical protein